MANAEAYQDVLKGAPNLYESGFGKAYQQLDTRVANFFRKASGGSALTIGVENFIETSDTTEVTSRFTDYSTPEVTNATRTWITAKLYHVTSWIPEEDKKELDFVGSYESAVLGSHAAAVHRLADSEVLINAFGDAKRGADITNTTTQALPAAQVIAVDANAAAATSLTLSKVKSGLGKFHEADITMIRPILVINSKINQDLVSSKIAHNRDYADMIKINAAGEVESFVGVPVVRTELVAESTPASGNYDILLANQDALVCHTPATEGKVNISFENKESAFLIKTKYKIGCARVRDLGIVKIIAQAGAPMTDNINAEW